MRKIVFAYFFAVFAGSAEDINQYVPREQADTVYLESERFYFAVPPKDCKRMVPLYVCKPQEEESEKFYLPITLSPFQIFCSPDVPPLSLFWFVKDRTPFSVMGDVGSSATGQYLIYLCPGVVREDSIDRVPDEIRKESCHIGPRPYNARGIFPLTGFAFHYSLSPESPYTVISNVNYTADMPPHKKVERIIRKEPDWKRLSKQENLWCGLSCTSIVARMPIFPAYVRWCPIENPRAVRWVEYLYDCHADGSSEKDYTLLHSEEFPWDGFTPIAITRVAGQKIKRDDLSIALPKDADWLIWEKNTNGVTRLCQMKAGRWSPVREVPRAPQTIVIDNDTEMVHLLYDFAIDRADIDDSLRRLASLLKPEQP